MFHRAYELNSAERDMYWHWSDMEAEAGEWDESIRAAEAGLKLFPSDRDLRFRAGYAQQRAAKELAVVDPKRAEALARRATAHLLPILAGTTDYISQKACRCLVLVAEVLNDGKAAAEYLKKWSTSGPVDYTFAREYDRLRLKFPDDIPRQMPNAVRDLS